jgi:hypothetical protein
MENYNISVSMTPNDQGEYYWRIFSDDANSYNKTIRYGYGKNTNTAWKDANMAFKNLQDSKRINIEINGNNPNIVRNAIMKNIGFEKEGIINDKEFYKAYTEKKRRERLQK